VSIDISPLLEPVSLAWLHLRNRFVMSPMTRNFSPGGVPGDDVAAYYTRRAMAKVGLIITEGVAVDHPASVGHGTMGEHSIPVMHGAAALAGWRKVVNSVHAAGGAIAAQLWHMGPIRLNGTPPNPEARSMRPSGVWGPLDKAMLPPAYLEQVREATAPMSDGEIADVIAGFARSAVNARDAGFDAVDLHGAHGYLIDAFFWSATNQRSDKWGRDRTLFATELVKAIRAAVGPDFPILFRLSQWKLQDYEARLADTPDELAAIVGALADAGVDIFDVSTRIFSTPAFEGSDTGQAGWVRKLSGKPVMTVGGIGFDQELARSFAEPTQSINNLDEVMRRFERDEFDLVAVGRALLMDPAWVLKASVGAPFEPFDLGAYGRLD
jgi:2,4-dienoyl-CoA reductase-like NADH-dependent reductase (Old Yellow Enzyme family)